MYLEDWMLWTLFILWLISLFDLWRLGLRNGAHATVNMLEDNNMILTEYDEDGNRSILTLKRVHDKDKQDE